MLSTRNEILDRAWQLGKILTTLKGQVGRGNWYLWLDANLPELGSTERARQANAARCMRLYRDNSDRRNSCGRLSVESVRKFMWGYIPAKERLQFEGDDAKFPRLASALNIANEFARLKQRHIDGLQPIDWEEVDSECTDLYETLKWRNGDGSQPDWV